MWRGQRRLPWQTIECPLVDVLQFDVVCCSSYQPAARQAESQHYSASSIAGGQTTTSWTAPWNALYNWTSVEASTIPSREISDADELYSAPDEIHNDHAVDSGRPFLAAADSWYFFTKVTNRTIYTTAYRLACVLHRDKAHHQAASPASKRIV